MSRAKEISRKNLLRAKRKTKIRGSICGTSETPRVSVFKSNKYLYAQAIDDVNANTIASASGKDLKLKATKEDVKQVAASLAEALKAKDVESIKFDRNGYLYHGVIASFADSLRENGIKF
jgi:large subunit ribosomal protein L18